MDFLLVALQAIHRPRFIAILCRWVLCTSSGVIGVQYSLVRSKRNDYKSGEDIEFNRGID
jgi:hypothetical protein